MFHFLILLVGATAAFDIEIHSKYEMLDRIEFVEYFNSLNLTYKVGVERLDRHKHCTFISHDITFPTVYHDVSQMELPESFDARERWPNCPSISKIFNQRECGSCWMFGTATTATDRNCIHANINKELSEQDLSCCDACHPGDVCDGGDPTAAFNFWVNNGLVSSNCQPYDSRALKNKQYCSQQCQDGNDYNQDKNHGGRVYQISSDESQIKAELVTNGPIEASMVVYSDLEDYTQGVYVHKYGVRKGYHSVRVIGYGVEGGVNYWLIANSWGMERGENGFYKIKRFQPELDFENHLLAAEPKNN